jgi:RNA polymerase sigma factor (sigma-70 family)
MSSPGASPGETGVSSPPTDYERFIQPIEDRMIRSVWRIVHDPHDFDDAFQEALAAIWKRLGLIRRHPNPHALIFRICANAAYDILRDNARRRRQFESIPDDVANPSSAIPDMLSGQEERKEVFRAIAQLPRKQAEAALMRFAQELPYTDIALALGCSEVTARTHVKRARTRLVRLLAHLAPHSPKEIRT